MDQFRNIITKREAKNTLERISKRFSGTKQLALEQIYDQSYHEAIKRIESQPSAMSGLARKALSWITYAERPLTTGELCHALAVGVGDDDLDEDNVPEVEDVISVCAGLVVVDEASNVLFVSSTTTTSKNTSNEPEESGFQTLSWRLRRPVLRTSRFALSEAVYVRPTKSLKAGLSTTGSWTMRLDIGIRTHSQSKNSCLIWPFHIYRTVI